MAFLEEDKIDWVLSIDKELDCLIFVNASIEVEVVDSSSCCCWWFDKNNSKGEQGKWLAFSFFVGIDANSTRDRPFRGYIIWPERRVKLVESRLFFSSDSVLFVRRLDVLIVLIVLKTLKNLRFVKPQIWIAWFFLIFCSFYTNRRISIQ